MNSIRQLVNEVIEKENQKSFQNQMSFVTYSNSSEISFLANQILKLEKRIKKLEKVAKENNSETQRKEK